MKKIILVLICLIGACGCSNDGAREVAIQYLNKFKNHNEEVMISLNELIKNENLIKEQQDMYFLIMKKQYDDLEYKVVDEIYNGNKALIKIEISVYDYAYSKKEAAKYKEEHPEEFILENNEVNDVKYKNLQLKYMENQKKRIKYTLTFSLKYEKDSWQLIPPDYKVLQKIHGIYDYEKED